MKIKAADVLVLGGGAAGLFFAAEAAAKGLSVRVIEGANKVGKKILMSGGGRCNFTNRDVQPKHFLSQNPKFCRSALASYSHLDFLALVKQAGIAYEERDLGKLFCQGSAKEIVKLLLDRCQQQGVEIELNQPIQEVEHLGSDFVVRTKHGCFQAERLVLALGGPSIPTLGASPLGYRLAEQFGHSLIPVRPALVPLTWDGQLKERFAALSGISLVARVQSKGGQSFSEPVLLTHRGFSGPAILQLSSYWQPGEAISIDWLHPENLEQLWELWQQQHGKSQLSSLLSPLLPSRLLAELLADSPLNWQQKVAELGKKHRQMLKQRLCQWQMVPSGTEGWRTAEVALGGVNTKEMDAKSLASKKQEGLYIIGELLDVTGWLGGYNFQWAWSSAYSCAKHL